MLVKSAELASKLVETLEDLGVPSQAVVGVCLLAAWKQAQKHSVDKARFLKLCEMSIQYAADEEKQCNSNN